MNALIKIVARKSAIDHLDAGYFDDTVAESRIKTGSFGIENYLAGHVAALDDVAKTKSTPRLASTSARSFSGCPA